MPPNPAILLKEKCMKLYNNIVWCDNAWRCEMTMSVSVRCSMDTCHSHTHTHTGWRCCCCCCAASSILCRLHPTVAASKGRLALSVNERLAAGCMPDTKQATGDWRGIMNGRRLHGTARVTCTDARQCSALLAQYSPLSITARGSPARRRICPV